MTTDWREYALREFDFTDDDDNPRAPTSLEERYVAAYTEYVKLSYHQVRGERDLIRTIVEQEDSLATLRTAQGEAQETATQLQAALVAMVTAAREVQRNVPNTGVGALEVAIRAHSETIDAALSGAPPTATLPTPDREQLGREVREEWVAFAREQPDPKPHHLLPWEELDEPNREVDRRIGERLWCVGWVRAYHDLWDIFARANADDALSGADGGAGAREDEEMPNGA